jgi:hypothetical protein
MIPQLAPGPGGSRLGTLPALSEQLPDSNLIFRDAI